MPKENPDSETSARPDPLLGFSPDEIVVGSGGQTLADVAATETADQNRLTARADDRERLKIACDIATGAATDPTAVDLRTRAAWRDLNAKGNGTETYRRALSPGGTWRFVSPDRLPRGTFLAGDRKACVRGDVYVGDLVADFDRPLRGGQSQGEAKHDHKIGLVLGLGLDGKGAEIEWMDAIRQKDGTVRVVLPTGAHLTVARPEWR